MSKYEELLKIAVHLIPKQKRKETGNRYHFLHSVKCDCHPTFRWDFLNNKVEIIHKRFV